MAANKGYVFAGHPDVYADTDVVGDVRRFILCHETH
jgi:hypothetical protein